VSLWPVLPVGRSLTIVGVRTTNFNLRFVAKQ
jgi:hypothetical protein